MTYGFAAPPPGPKYLQPNDLGLLFLKFNDKKHPRFSARVINETTNNNQYLCRTREFVTFGEDGLPNLWPAPRPTIGATTGILGDRQIALAILGLAPISIGGRIVRVDVGLHRADVFLAHLVTMTLQLEHLFA
jgi:hypothetical protein